MSSEQLQKQQEQQLTNLLNNSYGLSALQASAAANDAAAAGIPSAAALGYESMPMTRRLSNFGLGGLGALDRRGSGLLLDDFFGRRASIGFDIGMDRLFDRRDSMDSGAALEGAIMDFTRRRYSLLGGGAAGGASALDLAGLSGLSSGLGSGLGSLFSSSQNDSLQNLNAASGNSILAAHHERLLLQQRELEQRQKQLEEQRNLLFGNMGSGMSNLMQNNPLATQLQAQRLQDSLGFGSFNRNSLGLGSLSRGSLGLGGFNLGSLSQPLAAPPAPPKQWFICNVCNSQAFNSKEEHEAHERLCRQDAYAARVSKDEESDLNQKLLLEREMAKAEALEETQHPGPYQKIETPIPLALDSDKDWLTPLHCFIRLHCVEVFTATELDVNTPSKGKRKPIAVDQVGIRCPHCRHPDISDDSKESEVKDAKERGSTYYPTSLSSIYNAAMNLLQRHLHGCPMVPKEMLYQFDILKQDDARSGTSKRYWIESAKRLGLVDTTKGVRYVASAASNTRIDLAQENQTLANGADARGTQRPDASGASRGVASAADGRGVGMLLGNASNAAAMMQRFPQGTVRNVPTHDLFVNRSEKQMTDTAPLVFAEDKPYSTGFSFHLLSQMQPCAFTEADRLGKRKGLPHGFPGLACRHCYGGFGSGRFFPSSIKTLSDTSKTLNVLHNHMLRCRKCPSEIRELLESLRVTHNEERSKMKFGSQKAFFGRIWRRLHGSEAPGEAKRKKRIRDPDVESGDGDDSSESESLASPQLKSAAPADTDGTEPEDIEPASKRHREV